MSDLPEPLTPSDCDLRDGPAMMLDLEYLQNCDFEAGDNPQVFRANVLSWCASWLQVPAASLPGDEEKIVSLLGYGSKPDAWKKAGAIGGLRDWVLCSDGRLYHPVVASSALIAWRSLLSFRARYIRRLEMDSGEWAALRTAVFRRDGFVCTYCKASNRRLECDHVVPLSRGGLSTLDNLTTACKPCNRQKGAKSLQEWLL